MGTREMDHGQWLMIEKRNPNAFEFPWIFSGRPSPMDHSPKGDRIACQPMAVIASARLVRSGKKVDSPDQSPEARR
jgi:hypothetical protein